MSEKMGFFSDFNFENFSILKFNKKKKMKRKLNNSMNMKQ